MAKDKLKRFAENLTFRNLIQPEAKDILEEPHPIRGKWQEFFGNNNPITLEVGCGKGEYTIGLARMYPGRNFIGLDIKGARLWRGAKTALEENLGNVAFLRSRADFLTRFFAPDEVSEVWLTFSDPQPNNDKGTKRLSGPRFMSIYQAILPPGSPVHLKTDSSLLYDYTLDYLKSIDKKVLMNSDDIYADFWKNTDEATRNELGIKTFYEQKWLKQGITIKYIRWQL
jgi:tRNA (guanine-N7-)-methyltransferase